MAFPIPSWMKLFLNSSNTYYTRNILRNFHHIKFFLGANIYLNRERLFPIFRQRFLPNFHFSLVNIYMLCKLEILDPKLPTFYFRIFLNLSSTLEEILEYELKNFCAKYLSDFLPLIWKKVAVNFFFYRQALVIFLPTVLYTVQSYPAITNSKGLEIFVRYNRSWLDRGKL